MGYQSKTYSLSDEVVAAIEQARAQGETPNRYLQRLVQMERSMPKAVAADYEPLARELVVELDEGN